VKYAWVAKNKAAWPITMTCETLGVSASGYFEHQRRRKSGGPSKPGDARLSNEALLAHIRAIHAEVKGEYGWPRVWKELLARGTRVGKDRVQRLMKMHGVKARGKRKFVVTTDSRHDLPVAPNLLDRHFVAERPDTVWLADISYLPTGEGWLYLAAIEDLATREIVGWGMADHLRAELCVDALVMALQRRRPEAGLVHHSDRGVQYAAEPYRKVLGRHGIRQSMSRRGNCLDNAPMESFFASLKKEHVHHVRFRSRAEARAAVFEYVEIFYNRRRLHSGLGYRTPAEARADMEAIVMPAAA